MNIYVGNLGKDVTDEELQNEFAAYGYIKSVKIIRDLFSGESKGFGFVEMPGVAEAQKAIESLNAKEIGGKKIVVNEARPKTEGGRGGSRGGGGGSRGGRPGGGNGGSRGGGPRSGGGGRPGGGSRY
jgi:RNA recognition motif-containing protein